MNVGAKASLWMPVMLVLLLAGCDGDAAKKGAASGDAEAVPTADGLKRRAASSLPKIGDYLPPQDGGQIEVAPPAGWKTLPRGAFVAGFYKEKQNELPRITVDAQPAALGIDEASPENAEELAKKLTSAINRQSKSVQEPPRPIVLGETVFIRHVRLAKHGGSPAVIQSLQTVKNGRLYTVDLFCDVEAARADEYEGSLKKWRDQGYAVAANLKFHSPGGDPSTTPAGESPPASEAATETPPAAESPPADSSPPAASPAPEKPAEENPAPAKPPAANPAESSNP